MTWFSPKVEKRRSRIHGQGLFARAPIPAGELLVVKGGRVFDRATRDALQQTLGPVDVQIDDELFIGPVCADEREASMMYLNHGCDPNIGIVGQIAFHAMCGIQPDEELVFDYATGDNDAWQMQCRCGAEHCRGIITGQDWRLPAVQRRYQGWFSAYLARRIALAFS